MKNRSLFISLAASALIGLLVSACGPAATPTPEATAAPAATTEAPAAATTEAPAAATTEAPAAGPRTYVLMPKNMGNPYFDTANDGAQAAAKELGVTVKYQGPATADATAQTQMINDLISQKVSGLAISADDSDAVAPAGKAAMDAGIPVVSWDASIAKTGRVLHINQAIAKDIGEIELKMALDETGPDGGSIAILSAASTAPNQNAWIGFMNDALKTPAYAKLKLVDTVYGDDDDTKSYTAAQGLIKKYPDLKVIISPTTVGIAASARAVTDGKLIGKVFVTGLGTPNQMRDYVKSGAAPEFALWNPGDLGYLSIYALDALATKKITGKAGEKFTAGKLGEKTIEDDPDLGLNILLGLPTIFNKDNIDNFKF